MIPIKLYMENFISHVNSEIDFTKFDIALILGINEGNPNVANGCGKSAILDAIRFAIFGKTRFSKKERAVRHGQQMARVVLEFLSDDEIYKIERTLSKKTGAINVSFFIKRDDDWDSEGYTCDTPKLTTSKIEKIIGMNYDTFINSIYFSQSDIFGFANARVGKRKEILKEVLQMGIWDKYQESAKSKEKELNTQKILVEDRIDVLGNIESEIEKNKIKQKKIHKNILENEEEIGNLEKILKEAKKSVSILESSLQQNNIINTEKLSGKLDFIISKLDDIMKKRNSMKEEVNKNKQTYEEINKDNSDLQEKLKHLSMIAANSDFVGVEKAREILAKNDIQIEESKVSQMSIDKLSKKLESLIKKQQELGVRISQLNSVLPGEICPVCLQENSNPEETLEKRKKLEEDLQEKIEKVNESISKIKTKIKKSNRILADSKNALMEIERTELTISKKEMMAKEAQRKTDFLKEQFSSLVEERKKLKNEEKEIREILNKHNNHGDFQRDLENKKIEVARLENIIEDLKSKKINMAKEDGHITSTIESLERKLSEKEMLNNNKLSLLNEIKVYSKLSKAFGKDGIQSIIVENVTEDLRNYSNEFLKYISNEPMSLDFITQKQDTNGKWKEDFEIVVFIRNEESEFEDLSGGEQIRIAIALRLALSRLLMQRIGSNVRFLLLDEIDQALDIQGVEILSEALHSLSSEFKILLITHNDLMKEKFEDRITVVKNENGSFIA